MANFTASTHRYKFLRTGNIKLGKMMATWSTLMGDEEIDVPALGMKVRGTCQNCSSCKKDCYVAKSYRRYPSVPYGHARNTLGLRHAEDKVFLDLDLQLTRAKKPIRIVRLNQSGELESEEQFGRWCHLAAKHPTTKFYIYTKMYEYVIPAILAGKLPENFVVLLSVWHDMGAAEYEMVKHIRNVKAFVYDDGEELTVSPTIYCEAYDEKGHLNHNHSCETCGRCFVSVKNWKVVGCHAH